MTWKRLEAAVRSCRPGGALFRRRHRRDVVFSALANLRVKIARELGMIDETKLNFLWVTDFPIFEYSEQDGRFYSKHHPFTAPKAEFIGQLDNLKPEEADSVLAQAYDVVLNGVEIGGGSIRINTPELQSRIFSLLGISPEEAAEKFSFLIDALKFGAPPHGGLALGLDRIMMILLEQKIDTRRHRVPEDDERAMPDEQRAVTGIAGTAAGIKSQGGRQITWSRTNSKSMTRRLFKRICGYKDNNIKKIEKLAGVEIIPRGNTLIVKAVKEKNDLAMNHAPCHERFPRSERSRIRVR